jgi:hypothetical protein
MSSVGLGLGGGLADELGAERLHVELLDMYMALIVRVRLARNTSFHILPIFCDLKTLTL